MVHQIWLLYLVILTTLTPSSLTSRTDGGEKAILEQFPFMAFLQGFNDYDTCDCSASILSTTWAVSAAHCTQLSGNYVLIAGIVSSATQGPNAQMRNVARYINHPQYQKSNADNATQLIFDISLIQVQDPFTWNGFVKPINLENQARRYEPGECVAVGFGDSSTWKLGSIGELRYLNLSYEVDNCEKQLPFLNFTDHQLCSEEVGQINKGYSGGPLVCNDKQAGVASMFAVTITEMNKAVNVYTSVPHLYQWIIDNTDVSNKLKL